MIGITFALTYGVAQTKKVITLSPPEDYSLSDGVATIKFSQINDGHLHRFQYKAKDGTVMRFIIIKKNGGAYGVGLDACDNCGDAGYYEKDGKIICKKCDVASTSPLSDSRAAAILCRSIIRLNPAKS